MIDAGMDACRLNMSHCSHEMGQGIVASVREAAESRGGAVPIGADLRGPKLRIGDVAGGSVALEEGTAVLLTSEPDISTAARISIDYPDLAASLRPGNTVFLHDGFIALRVERVSDREVLCVVETGGMLLPRKGVNLPGVSLHVPSVTQKDREDIEFAISAKVDFLFVSYARSASHIKEVRQTVARMGGSLPLIAKIERQDGVDALEEIVREADGVCIARGDLGIEVPVGRVPGIQRDASRLSAAAGKFVMNGGQLLSSMVSSPLPLRAEVADLAAVVRDQLDAIVLSDETAAGQYPVETVAMAARVLSEAEDYERNHGGALRTSAGMAAPLGRV